MKHEWIRSFWNDVITQNREALPKYFKEDALIIWHCTKETFTVEQYVKVNCDYPGSWDGEIEKIMEIEDGFVLAGHVVSKDKTVSCHVVSFIELDGEKISKLEEYWADDGEAPEWRKEWHLH